MHIKHQKHVVIGQKSRLLRAFFFRTYVTHVQAGAASAAPALKVELEKAGGHGDYVAKIGAMKPVDFTMFRIERSAFRLQEEVLLFQFILIKKKTPHLIVVLLIAITRGKCDVL